MQHTSFSNGVPGVGGSTPSKSRTPLRDINNISMFSPMKNYGGASSSFDTSIVVKGDDKRLRELDEENAHLKAALQAAEKTVQTVRNERDKFEIEVRRLTRTNNAVEESKAAGGGTSNWAKMTAQARETSRLEEECTSLKRRCEVLQSELDGSAHEHSGHRERVAALESETAALKSELTHATSKLIDAMVLEKKYHEARGEVVESTAALDARSAELEQSAAALEALQSEHLRLEAEHMEVRGQFEDYQRLYNRDSIRLHAAPDGDATEGTDADSPSATEVAELREKLRVSEATRRQLHAKIQELRGNVRVFVRVRPLLSGDRETRDTSVVCNKDTNAISLVQALPAGTASSSSVARPLTHQFSFDRVFDQGTQQADVFEDVQELVQSAMDGYRICLFSYGQTGSGKTHTMTGEPSGHARGLIPRSMELILRRAVELGAAGWTVRVSMSILELYNEELRDLLPAETASNTNPSIGAKDKDKLRISFQGGKVTVHGLSAHAISLSDSDGGAGPAAVVESGLSQLRAFLARANHSRTTAATNMNEHSSRSHVIYMIDVSGRLECAGAGTATTLEGGLRLVDLAGSERVDCTGTAGDATRFKESVNINKSLSCIADVFTAMHNKKGGAGHVPFRNSKLTMLLQDCLSGEGKALMMVNVSPTEASLGESLCSLRFAGQVNQVELGKAKKHAVTAATAPAPVATAPVAQHVATTATVTALSTAVGAIKRRQSIFPGGAGAARISQSAPTPAVSVTGASDSEEGTPKPTSGAASAASRRRLSVHPGASSARASLVLTSVSDNEDAPGAAAPSTLSSDNFYARKLAASASASVAPTAGAKRLNCGLSAAPTATPAPDAVLSNREPAFKRCRSSAASSASAARGVFTKKISL